MSESPEKIFIPESWAASILGGYSWMLDQGDTFSETDEDVLEWIFEHYPELKDQNRHLA